MSDAATLIGVAGMIASPIVGMGSLRLLEYLAARHFAPLAIVLPPPESAPLALPAHLKEGGIDVSEWLEPEQRETTDWQGRPMPVLTHRGGPVLREELDP